MPIRSVPDHVAVATPSIGAAAHRWHDELGGRWVAPRWELEGAGFATRQLRFRGGAKLELLEPTDDHGFAAGFLDRFGARIHHVTLKVDALLPAVAQLETEGLPAVDVRAEGDIWHEAFLRPSLVGGLIVQVAWAGRSEDDWAALAGVTPEAPGPDAAVLLGPTLTHPDLDAAGRVWRSLGAEVELEGSDAFTARWDAAPLTVRVEHGVRADAVGLRFHAAPSLPPEPDRAGPATVVTAAV